MFLPGYWCWRKGNWFSLWNVQETCKGNTGVLTGKGINWGGSLIRPEATVLVLFILQRKCLNKE